MAAGWKEPHQHTAFKAHILLTSPNISFTLRLLLPNRCDAHVVGSRLDAHDLNRLGWPALLSSHISVWDIRAFGTLYQNHNNSVKVKVHINVLWKLRHLITYLHGITFG